MAGRRIDDHSSFMGKGSEYPLPVGNKMKRLTRVEGAGSLSDYPDTEEAIARDQKEATRKVEGKKVKSGYRY